MYPTLFVPCITQGSKQVTSSPPVYTQGKNSVVILFAPLYTHIQAVVSVVALFAPLYIHIQAVVSVVALFVPYIHTCTRSKIV